MQPALQLYVNYSLKNARSLCDRLMYNLNLFPSIHSRAAQERPSLLPTSIATPQKTPKVRNVQPDELEDFSIADFITKLDDIDSIKQCTTGYECKRTEEGIVFYQFSTSV